MTDYTHHVFGTSEVIVGMDLDRPGGDKTTFVRARYDRDQVIIIDDPLNDEPVTEAQKAKFLEWFHASMLRNFNNELRMSFRMSEERCADLTRSILDDLVDKIPVARGTAPVRRVPYYRQHDRQLNGRRR